MITLKTLSPSHASPSTNLNMAKQASNQRFSVDATSLHSHVIIDMSDLPSASNLENVEPGSSVQNAVQAPKSRTKNKMTLTALPVAMGAFAFRGLSNVVLSAKSFVKGQVQNLGLTAAQDQNDFIAFWGPTNSPSLWQTLFMAALNGSSPEFALESHAMMPHWNAEMKKSFFEDQSLERWSMLPGGTQLKDAVLKMGEGPLRKIAPPEQMLELGTSEQYLVRRTDQAEETFKKLRDTFGSSFYFHGSPIGNWHQIISQGLESKSGTKMQANGAAHGGGVYVATETWLSNHFVGNTKERVLGVVEVIEHPLVSSFMHARIVPRAMLLAVRVLAVYQDGMNIPNVAATSIEHKMSSLIA